MVIVLERQQSVAPSRPCPLSATVRSGNPLPQPLTPFGFMQQSLQDAITIASKHLSVVSSWLNRGLTKRRRHPPEPCVSNIRLKNFLAGQKNPHIRTVTATRDRPQRKCADGPRSPTPWLRSVKTESAMSCQQQPTVGEPQHSRNNNLLICNTIRR